MPASRGSWREDQGGGASPPAPCPRFWVPGLGDNKPLILGPLPKLLPLRASGPSPSHLGPADSLWSLLSVGLHSATELDRAPLRQQERPLSALAGRLVFTEGSEHPGLSGF